MKLLWQKKVFSNRQHNAFTDLAWHDPYYYLAFRTGKEHLSDGSKLILMRSQNAKKWERIPSPKTRDDIRDPKFFSFAGNFGLTFIQSRRNTASTFFSLADGISLKKGINWTEPKLLRAGWVAWRAKRYKGKLLTPFYKYVEDEGLPEDWAVEIFDGKTFHRVLSGSKVRMRPNETELVIDNGNLFAFIRVEGHQALGCRLDLEENKVSDWFSFQNRALQGPCALTLNGRHFISGRAMASCASIDPDNLDSYEVKCWFERLSIAEFDFKKKEVVDNLILCAGKKIDCGYCGMVKNQEKRNRFFVSYYKGNGKKSSIYVGEVEV